MTQELVDFVKEHYTIPLYLVAWIISVIRYKRYYDTVLKYFPVFIIYTFLTELLGYFIKHTDEFQFFSDYRYAWHNIVIFNIYSVVSFTFFYYIYWKVLKNEKHKVRVKYASMIAALGYLVSLLFQNPLHIGLYYADLLASIVLLYAIGLYFIEKRTEQSYYSMRDNLMFWVSIGLFIFHIFFPFIFIAAYDWPIFYYEYRLHEFLMILIVIMYLFFIAGFLLGKRKAFR
ncbi:hypothetical protein [uncultured Allomuricauda sp.]|uniref:hypothetical protein n=1 Tax=Flagellimonas sp. W118 TaxID=3410791 RepID=UPI002613E6D6|nr:hypothetical protein [uncultured Allomuricauda sp.]